MDYINQIYYGLKEETINSYKDLKWTSLNSKEQLHEWYEIGDKDKESINKLYYLDSDEYEEISYNEKMLLWSAINMVLRQHWKLSKFQNGKIWKNNPQCIDNDLSDKLLKQTLDYIKNLVNDDYKTKSLLAKIMGFIHNNDSEDEEKKYIKTEYLKSQYDSFLNNINKNIYSNNVNASEDSKFSIYLKLFDNKYENKEDDNDNIKIDKQEEEEIIQEIIDEEKDAKEDNKILTAGIEKGDDKMLTEKIKEVGSRIMDKNPKKSFNFSGGRRKKKKRRNKKTRRLKIRKKTKRKYKKRKNKQRKTRKKKRTRRKLKIKIKKKKKKTRKKKYK